MLQPTTRLTEISEPLPMSTPLSAELARADALNALGQSAAAVLHELRGPLQAVRAHVQVLERKARGASDAGGLAGHFAPIYGGIDHINDLLEQFLSLSRIQPAHLTELDMADAIGELLPLLRSMATVRRVGLMAEIAAQLPPCYGDERQLKRLVFNLFINACDACEDALKPLVRISLAREQREIMLSVSDNGCGIGADRLDKIWEPFYTSKAAGTGLGLPCCREIAREHGGSLTALSRAGEGSSFVLRLPIR